VNTFQYNNVLVQMVRREVRIEKASLQHMYQPLVHAGELQPIQACTRQYGATENPTVSMVILQDASLSACNLDCWLTYNNNQVLLGVSKSQLYQHDNQLIFSIKDYPRTTMHVINKLSSCENNK
jgi:hypothetical protein